MLRRTIWPGRLSARLLILTVALVSLAGVLILFPSLAAFEERWLRDRVALAETASFAFDTAVDKLISPTLAKRLRDSAGVVGISVFDKEGLGLSLLKPEVDPDKVYWIDFRSQNTAAWLAAPFRTLTSGPDRYINITAKPK